jgi:GNAT superfamily N-acetyltransferase
MDPIIRFAQPDDADAIYGFICELAVYEREPQAVKVTPDALRSQLAMSEPPFECLIAEAPSGEAVGFALFFSSYSTWRGRPGIYLEDLYVPEPMRGRGIGMQLFQRLGELAIERGCARLEWAVLDWNQPAINFYQSVDATPLEGWTTWRLTNKALERLAGVTGTKPTG